MFFCFVLPKAICRQKCQNGGSCVRPDVCQCLSAFHGPLCELDVDECATGVHRCTDPASHCVNMAGWYYCACNPGFQSKQQLLYPTVAAAVTPVVLINNDTAAAEGATVVVTGGDPPSNLETTGTAGSMCRGNI